MLIRSHVVRYINGPYSLEIAVVGSRSQINADDNIVFLSRVSILMRDNDIANLSVRLSLRPSVRPLRSGIGFKRLNILS